MKVVVFLRERKQGAGQNEPQPELLSSTDETAFAQGKTFYVLYGTVYYSDFFRVEHWVKVCQPIAVNLPGKSFWTYKRCTDYADIDTN